MDPDSESRWCGLRVLATGSGGSLDTCDAEDATFDSGSDRPRGRRLESPRKLTAYNHAVRTDWMWTQDCVEWGVRAL